MALSTRPAYGLSLGTGLLSLILSPLAALAGPAEWDGPSQVYDDWHPNQRYGARVVTPPPAVGWRGSSSYAPPAYASPAYTSPSYRRPYPRSDRYATGLPQGQPGRLEADQLAAELTQRCNVGRLLGGLVGGGVGYAASRQDGRTWAVPLGALLGQQMGCNVSKGGQPVPW